MDDLKDEIHDQNDEVVNDNAISRKLQMFFEDKMIIEYSGYLNFSLAIFITDLTVTELIVWI